MLLGVWLCIVFSEKESAIKNAGPKYTFCASFGFLPQILRATCRCVVVMHIKFYESKWYFIYRIQIQAKLNYL